MSAEQEIETQRRDAVKAALVMTRALNAEESGLKKKLKGVKDRRKAMFAALERNSVAKAAFEEAVKRAQQDEEELNLFDTEASEIEGWARDWLAENKNPQPETEPEGPQLTPEEQQDIAEQNAEAHPDPDATIPPEADTISASDDGDPDGAAPAAVQFEDDPAVAAEDPAQAEAEPEWDMGQTPAADPDAGKKTAAIAPSAGAGGVSMDDIPMPKSQIHDLQQEAARRPRGFVDRRERMTAEEYNQTVGKAESA